MNENSLCRYLRLSQLENPFLYDLCISHRMSVLHIVSMTVQKKEFSIFVERYSFHLQEVFRVSDRLGMLTFQMSFLHGEKETTSEDLYYRDILQMM